MEKAPFCPAIAEYSDDLTAYWVRTVDNIRLRIAHWPISSQPARTVFLLQGRTENIEKYGRTAAN